MKKTLTFLLIIAAIFLASCNADQNIGIFAEVAASQTVAGINITRYLGNDGTDNYVLSDTGIYKSSETDPIFENSPENGIIASACLVDGEILVIMDNGKPGKLSKDGQSYKLVLDDDENTYVYLTMNGTYIKSGYYSVVIESEDSLLYAAYYEEIDRYAIIINNLAISDVEKADSFLKYKPIGFQKLSDGSYIIMTSAEEFYSVHAGGNLIPIATANVLSTKTGSSIASFAVGTTAYFKGSSSFVEVSKENKVVFSGAASDLATVAISNIVKTDDGWIAATYKNGLYKIDGVTLQATPISL